MHSTHCDRRVDENVNEDQEHIIDLPAEPTTQQLRALEQLLAHGRLTEAEDAANTLLARYPELGFGWKVKGVALKLQGRHGEALRTLHRAAKLLPNDAQTQSNLGAALAEANELAAARMFHRRALQIDPRYTPAYTNLGKVLCQQGRLQEAEACHRRALDLQPDHAEGLHNLGSTLHDQGRILEAEQCYRRALAIFPEHAPGLAQTHWNLGMCQLTRGDFAGGWPEYEWRRETASFRSLQRPFAVPAWRGSEPLLGKTVLLHAEQGLGDTLQFCRYAALVAAHGARVFLQAPAVLEPLLRTLPGIEYLTMEASLPACDYHCPLLSLPLAFGTSLADIPAAVPYLYADSAKVDAWREKLGQASVPRIGVAWAGQPLHRHDYRRSIALDSFLCLTEAAGNFYCLHKELRPAERVILEKPGNIRMLTDDIDNFADTAAIIELMDLIVTVDTAVAHLAAAMGKQVWILLPKQADWRWLQDRADSPWYPTVRLFRQHANGDWCGVLQEVRQEMAKFIG